MSIFCLLGHSKGGTSVTLAAVFKPQISPKNALSVVTRRARLPARGDEMFSRRSRAYLACLRRAGRQLVTVDAGEPVSWTMIRVAERVAIRARVGWRGPIRFLFVADAARGDFTSGG